LILIRRVKVHPLAILLLPRQHAGSAAGATRGAASQSAVAPSQQRRRRKFHKAKLPLPPTAWTRVCCFVSRHSPVLLASLNSIDTAAAQGFHQAQMQENAADEQECQCDCKGLGVG